jgi:uncharacterized protein (TIGR00730 family)
MIRSLCVFCGSRPAGGERYREVGERFGRLVARSGLELVYGGSSIGLMGIVADAALAAGGRVTGVIPDFMVAKELAHRGLHELIVVDSMHARKRTMAERSDAFVALPGGFGTLEEYFEVLTWSQLRLHRRPVALLNVRGFFDPLLAFMDHAVAEEMLRPEHRSMALAHDDPEALLALLQAQPAPEAPVGGVGLRGAGG